MLGLGRKKKTYGIQPKAKTRTEMSREYDFHAHQLGHKVRMAAEHATLIVQLESEMEIHKSTLLKICAEIVKLPEEPSSPPAVPPSDAGTEGTAA